MFLRSEALSELQSYQESSTHWAPSKHIWLSLLYPPYPHYAAADSINKLYQVFVIEAEWAKFFQLCL